MKQRTDKEKKNCGLTFNVLNSEAISNIAKSAVSRAAEVVIINWARLSKTLIVPEIKDFAQVDQNSSSSGVDDSSTFGFSEDFTMVLPHKHIR